MDFEEQLEKAERLESPSLVGSSLRSADDSPHNNYIHPEKYKTRPKNKNAHSLLNSQIGASLDDLISEGALLGSEEDFEKFLDDGGHVKDDARYLETDGENAEKEKKEKIVKERSSPLKNEVNDSELTSKLDGELAKNVDDQSLLSHDSKSVDAKASASESSIAVGDSESKKDGLYSTPNLSEYQLEHLIKDHNEMLSYVKSHNLDKLPGYRAEPKNAQLLRDSRVPLALPTTASFGDAVAIHTGPSEGLHTPYFQHDGRSRSRSQNRSRIAERSRSRSSVKPHLARGDSYKNIHEDEPSKYELPSDWEATEEEENTDGDRRSRQSKPTLGDSIAAAEAAREQQKFHQDARASSAASLLTTGDYTNFNVDIPEPTYFNGRSASSTNYLRSISRSRSRQPESKRHSQLTEKNDADPEELISEGALVTDDPYSSINHLDTMMEEVLGKKDDKKEEKGAEAPTPNKAIPETDVSKADATKKSNDSEREKGSVTDAKEELPGKANEKEETEAREETTKDEKEDAKDETKEPAVIETSKVETEGDTAHEKLAPSEDNEELAVPTEDQLKKANDVISEDVDQDEKDIKVEVPDVKEKEEENPTEEIKKKGESQEAEPEKKTLITDYTEPINQDSVPEDKEPAAAKNDDVVGETMVTKPEEKKDETSKQVKDKQVEKGVQVSKEPVKEVKDDDDFDVSPEELRKHLESQPVYIFTSFAGGMQIMHRTNRLATILKGNGIEFTQRDLGTDEEAKKIWRRYSAGKTLPGVVRGDDFIGNWEDIDEANEEYQVRVLVYETL